MFGVCALTMIRVIRNLIAGIGLMGVNTPLISDGRFFMLSAGVVFF
jgi:hypothetical protein